MDSVRTGDLTDLLRRALRSGASDVILSSGAAPAYRINGQVVSGGDPPLTAESARRLVYGSSSTSRSASTTGTASAGTPSSSGDRSGRSSGSCRT